jgi:uncharacterized protein YodC (DUF2158 family)
MVYYKDKIRRAEALTGDVVSLASDSGNRRVTVTDLSQSLVDSTMTIAWFDSYGDLRREIVKVDGWVYRGTGRS